MAHKITPKGDHILITVEIALRPTIRRASEATDGLNELFNEDILAENGMIADFRYMSNLRVLSADADPEEGSLFH